MLSRLFERWQAWMVRRGSWKMIRLDSDGRSGATEPYLERYYLLKLPGFSLFLHRFWASDPEGVHEHPWDWGRIILRGGYAEEGADGKLTWCPPGSVRRAQAEVFHRLHVAVPGDTWTLFWHWRRRREWGFLDPKTGQWAPSPGNHTRQPMQGWLFPRIIKGATR